METIYKPKRGSLLCLISILLISCFEKRENEVNVHHVDDRISIGMTKEELKKEIGEPADSIHTESIGCYHLMYFTNDFSDYRLNVYFDCDDKVIMYTVD